MKGLACKNLFLEPYRVFFLVGSLMAVSSGIHWYFFFGPAAHVALSFPWPAYQLHAYQMVYVTFSYFAFGFLLTAFPRWVGSKPVSRELVWICLVALILSEGFLFLLIRHRGFVVALAGAQGVGFGTLILALMQKLCTSGAKKREQPVMVILALTFGWLGSILGTIALFAEDAAEWAALSAQIGIYAYIFFLIMVVASRIVPFFTHRALENGGREGRKYFRLVILVVITARVLSFIYWDRLVTAVLDCLILVFVCREVIWWSPPRTWKAITQVPLLAMLYLALFWVVVFFMRAVIALVLHVGFPAQELVFLQHEKDFLHFFTLGGVGTLLLAMMTRVTRGHGGISLMLGFSGALAIGWMHLALLVRVAFPFFHRLAPYKHGAALFWTLAFFTWMIGYVPILLSGRPEEEHELQKSPYPGS